MADPAAVAQAAASYELSIRSFTLFSCLPGLAGLSLSVYSNGYLLGENNPVHACVSTYIRRS